MANKAEQKNQARIKREAAQAAAAAAARRNRNLQFAGGAAFAAILVVLIVVLISGGDKSKKVTGLGAGGSVEGVAETTSLLKGIPQRGLELGDAKAPITIVEYLDVQCPFCKAHELDQQPTVINDVVKTGQAILKAQPVALPQMGEDSEAGRAVALREARNNKFWNFVNLFYWNQGNEATGYVTDAFLQKLVDATGAPKVSTNRTPDAADAKIVKQIEDDAAALQAKEGSFGTPTFLIGETGKPVSTYKLFTASTSSDQSTGDQIVAAVKEAAKKAGV